MTKYRKKPVVIEAERLTLENADELARWSGGRVHRTSKPSDHDDVRTVLVIPTLEGNMTGTLGDYIIRGVQGEFYPCKPDIFNATYEAAE